MPEVTEGSKAKGILNYLIVSVIVKRYSYNYNFQPRFYILQNPLTNC